MAVMSIKSTDPKFSFHLKKNPQGGLVSKKMRSGVLTGWFPHGNPQEYALWFKETSTENSFSNDDKNFLDLTQYASTYFAFQSITTLFNQVLKLDSAQEEFEHEIHLPLVQLRTERTIQHLNQFIGLDMTISQRSSDDVTRMALFDITFKSKGTFNAFMMKVYLMFYLLHGDQYQSDIVFMEAMIGKVVGVMQELQCEYFLWYWFKKNILIKPKFYADLEDKLGKGSVDGPMYLGFGDTQMQRKDFADKHMDFTVPILDVGCGEGYYVLPYAKKMKDKSLPVVGVDPVRIITDKLNVKIETRKLNALAVNSLEEVEIEKPHDILCIEVIEHMPMDEARELVKELLGRNFRKLIISTPNVEFNQFYRTMTGFRHDDHHFELNRSEFEAFIKEVTDDVFAEDAYSLTIETYGVGDKVQDIPMAQACVITNRVNV